MFLCFSQKNRFRGDFWGAFGDALIRSCVPFAPIQPPTGSRTWNAPLLYQAPLPRMPPGPRHHDALPRAHMASGVLHRSASRCLRPAAAPTPDSGRGHGGYGQLLPALAFVVSWGFRFAGTPLCLSLGFLGCRRSVIRGRAVLLCGWEDLAGE